MPIIEGGVYFFNFYIRKRMDIDKKKEKKLRQVRF